MESIKIDTDIKDYLKGNQFSNPIKIKISRSEKSVPLRVDLVKEIVKNKQIIHFGCVDHLPIIEEKINNHSWLHELLLESASKCFGVDNNKEGIEYIKKLGYKDVFCFNILDDTVAPEIVNQQWDYLVLGEILEHINDPVEFLRRINAIFSVNAQYVLITVPYAFKLHNFQNAFKHTEVINSDHRYWFTPYTLAKVLTLAGFEVTEFTFCSSYKLTKFSFLRKFVLSRFPGLRDNLLMIAKFDTAD